MNGSVTIEGTVVDLNSIRSTGRIVHCWINDMQAAVAPQPLDLSAHLGKVVQVSGNLHGDLWNASFEDVITDDDAHRPVALLWGGWQERLRHGREQENWTYAIDLGKVLDRLNLELLG